MADYKRIDDYIVSLIQNSTPAHTAWNLEKIRQGKENDWNYIDGCMLTALMKMCSLTGKSLYFDFVEQVADYFVQADGSIKTFNRDKHSLDDINEGRILFDLYDKTGKEKYRLAADNLYAALKEQPRTVEGNFWHKAIYPNQVWLDGIYMAQPFYALYEKHFGDGSCRDTLDQIRNVHDKMRSAENGLYYHGYDASRKAFWADPVTGCSKNFWLRALGWFSVALADLCEILDGSEREEIRPIFADLMASIKKYQDPESGLYYQVADQGGREGNYLETSGSAMMAYAMQKGARLGVLPEEFRSCGMKAFQGIMDKYLSFTESGLNLGGICLVAGLGPEDNRRRDGSFEYYISEPVVENDAKGSAPFILAYTEVMQQGAAQDE